MVTLYCQWTFIRYDVMGVKVGTKWKIYMETCMFLCFHVYKLHESMKTIHDQTKNACFLVFSSFSAHFTPHYIIMDKANAYTLHVHVYVGRGGEGIVRTCTIVKCICPSGFKATCLL